MLRKLAVVATLVTSFTVAHASGPVTFDLRQLLPTATSIYNMDIGGIKLSVTAFKSNSDPASVSAGPLGVGVYTGVDSYLRIPFLGRIPVFDSRLVDDNEYLLFTFDKAVTLNGFGLSDWFLDGNNKFSLNGTTTDTGGWVGVGSLALGPTNQFAFRSMGDDFWVTSLTVTKYTAPPPPVPEPGAIAMMLAGLGVVGMVATRRKKAA